MGSSPKSGDIRLIGLVGAEENGGEEIECGFDSSCMALTYFFSGTAAEA